MPNPDAFTYTGRRHRVMRRSPVGMYAAETGYVLLSVIRDDGQEGFYTRTQEDLDKMLREATDIEESR